MLKLTVKKSFFFSEYVNLYVDYLLNKSIYQQFASFYHGFHSVCASNALIVSISIVRFLLHLFHCAAFQSDEVLKCVNCLRSLTKKKQKKQANQVQWFDLALFRILNMVTISVSRFSSLKVKLWSFVNSKSLLVDNMVVFFETNLFQWRFNINWRACILRLWS